MKQIEFTAEYPQKADVIGVFSFSAHHFGEHASNGDVTAGTVVELHDTIRDYIQKLNPRFISILDMDMKGMGLEDFKKTFKSFDALMEVFHFGGRDVTREEMVAKVRAAGGTISEDYRQAYEKGIALCHRFHTQFGKDDYVKILETEGYDIEEVMHGSKGGWNDSSHIFSITAARKEKQSV